VVGGLLSNSLALLSDALHNLGDGFAVLIAFIAFGCCDETDMIHHKNS